MSFSTSWLNHKAHKENNNNKKKSFVIFVYFVVKNYCVAFEQKAVDT
jgi:hypothetical protein